MSTLETCRAVLAPLVLAALLVLAGDGATTALRLRGGRRLALAGVMGLVLLHATLAVEQALGVRWSAASVIVPLALVGAIGAWRRARTRGAAPIAPRSEPALDRVDRLDWGDAVAMLALLVLTALAWTLWIGNPDFVYHWGLKGHRFALAGGIDWSYLEKPWSWVLHPDYPNLAPEIHATTALVAGNWHEPSQLLWTPLLIAAILVAARAALRENEVAPLERCATVAALALALVAFAIGYQMAGAADWTPALALAAAAPALLDRRDAGDAEIGLCAALAAASKIEGMALAACLVAVQLGRRALRRERPRAPQLVALVLPPLLVIAHWAVLVRAHHLFQQGNVGSTTVAHLAAAGPALLQAMRQPAWNGLPFLLPLALVVALAARRTRALGCVVALQLAFDLWTYAATPLDPAQLALTTFARLLLQVLPATFAAAAVAAVASGGGALGLGGGGAGGPHLHHLGEDGDGDLAGGVAADGQPDRRVQLDAVE